MVLVGPSGCGKTTSLRMINRLVEPSQGTILLDGTDIRTRKPAQLRRGIGYVIQQTGLFPHRTVEDNIGTVPVLSGWSRKKARDRARELLTLVGLDQSLARRYPHQLSGGQQQRVGVARALAADPPVLLMDEPFSAVDPVVRAALQDQLISLQAELRKTIVLVTHDIEEAIKVGDLVALFRPHGTLAQLATAGDAARGARRRLRGRLRRLRPRHQAAVVRPHRGAGPGHGPGAARGRDRRQGPGRRRAVDPRHRPAGRHTAGLGGGGEARRAARRHAARPGGDRAARPHLHRRHRLAARRARRRRAVPGRPGGRRGRRRPGARRRHLRPAARRHPGRGRGRRRGRPAGARP